MTVLNPPMGVQSRTDNNADDLRRAITAPFLHDSTNRPRAGVVPGWGGELAVTAPGGAMTVSVASGAIVIPNPTAGNGGYHVVNDGALSLTIAASNATNARIDLVIARVADPSYYAGGDGLGAIKVITGTASATPAVPTVATSEGAYVVLAQVAVAANATTIVAANLTKNTTADLLRTTGVGGVLTVANSTQRDAIVTKYAGLQVFRLDTLHAEVWTGTTWVVTPYGYSTDVEPSAAAFDVRSGAMPGTGWAVQTGYGRWQRRGGYVNASGMLDLGNNGPAYQTTALTHVPMPDWPLDRTDQTVVGTWEYVSDTGAFARQGLVTFWNASTASTGPRGLLRDQNGDAQLGTSYRYRMSWQLGYFTS